MSQAPRCEHGEPERGVYCKACHECKHCWHSGSDIDSAGYLSDGSGWSKTHLMCCHCGRVKVDEKKWGPRKPLPDPVKHGKHDWPVGSGIITTYYELGEPIKLSK